MSEKNSYKTKQLDMVLSYLKENKGKHVTALDMEKYFKENSIQIGMTTIYRHLERLKRDGLVAKYNISSTDSACFEYLGDSVSHSYHFKCERCGKLLHIQCKEIDNLESHLLMHHNLLLDPSSTVFYGLCEECKSEKENEDK